MDSFTGAGQGLTLKATDGFLRGHRTYLDGNSVEFSPDGKRLISLNGHTVRVWDVLTGRKISTLRSPLHEASARAVAYSPDGSRIVVGYEDGTVRIWDATWPKELQPS